MRRANWVINAPQHNQLNNGNPITRGLVSYFPCNEGGGWYPRDVLSKTFTQPPTMQGTVYVDKNFVTGNAAGGILYPSYPSVNFEGTDTFSLSAWFKLTTNPGGYQVMSHINNLSTGWLYWVNRAASQVAIYLINDFSGGKYITCAYTITLNLGEWNHAVFTYTGNKDISGVSCYANGKVPTLAASINALGTNTMKADVAFGICARQGNATYFPGHVKNLAIWNRVLSEQEAQRLYTEPYCMLAQKKRSSRTSSLTNIKNIDGLEYANIKSRDGLAMGSVKSVNGLN